MVLPTFLLGFDVASEYSYPAVYVQSNEQVLHSLGSIPRVSIGMEILANPNLIPTLSRVVTLSMTTPLSVSLSLSRRVYKRFEDGHLCPSL